MLSNINPFVSYMYQRLGKYSVIGLSLTFCGLLLFGFNFTYQLKKLAILKIELAEITHKKNLSVRQLESNGPENFYGILNFPKKSELHNVIEFIHVSAQQNNLFVDNVDYKFTELPSIHMVSYEVTLPISGKYLDVRAFISQLSKKYAGVILQNVELSRENSQVNNLDGFLQLNIYVNN
ncbi:MAG: hypothetical protein HOO90_05675 [Methylotenera sp.]|uniref:hypothetical protein n=1 Tax=Methylotenera sp. TaxID=2051956 RepID=UPI0018355343|nr:hypothetical protein [Methylotenera sp.]NOU25007.1 hypothetical protein [Methylotenera sp.]